MTWPKRRTRELPPDWPQRRSARLAIDGDRCTALLPSPSAALLAEVKRLHQRDETLAAQRAMLDGVQWTFLTVGDALPAGTRFQRCPHRATDVDHHVRDNDHRIDDLRSLCDAHHKKKTQREAQRAQGRGIARLRPKDRHPGLVE